jgi:hypothetical protein
MDARGAPKRVRGGHAGDQNPDLCVDGRTTSGGAARELGPVLAEAAPLPSEDGVRSHDHEGLPPPGPDLGQAGPEEPVRHTKPRPTCRSLVDGELLAQSQVFDSELAMAAEEKGEESHQVKQEGDHRVGIVSGSALRDQLPAGRTRFWRRTGRDRFPPCASRWLSPENARDLLKTLYRRRNRPAGLGSGTLVGIEDSASTVIFLSRGASAQCVRRPCRPRVFAARARGVGVLLALAVLLPATAVAEERARKDVLLLYADSMLLPANVVADRELRSALGADATTPVRFYTEALDLSWFPDKEVEHAMLDLLRAKYANRNLALVIPVGPPWPAGVSVPASNADPCLDSSLAQVEGQERLQPLRRRQWKAEVRPGGGGHHVSAW